MMCVRTTHAMNGARLTGKHVDEYALTLYALTLYARSIILLLYAA